MSRKFVQFQFLIWILFSNSILGRLYPDFEGVCSFEWDNNLCDDPYGGDYHEPEVIFVPAKPSSSQPSSVPTTITNDLPYERMAEKIASHMETVLRDFQYEEYLMKVFLQEIQKDIRSEIYYTVKETFESLREIATKYYGDPIFTVMLNSANVHLVGTYLKKDTIVKLPSIFTCIDFLPQDCFIHALQNFDTLETNGGLDVTIRSTDFLDHYANQQQQQQLEEENFSSGSRMLPAWRPTFPEITATFKKGYHGLLTFGSWLARSRVSIADFFRNPATITWLKGNALNLISLLLSGVGIYTSWPKENMDSAYNYPSLKLQLAITNTLSYELQGCSIQEIDWNTVNMPYRTLSNNTITLIESTNVPQHTSAVRGLLSCMFPSPSRQNLVLYWEVLSTMPEKNKICVDISPEILATSRRLNEFIDNPVNCISADNRNYQRSIMLNGGIGVDLSIGQGFDAFASVKIFDANLLTMKQGKYLICADLPNNKCLGSTQEGAPGPYDKNQADEEQWWILSPSNISPDLFVITNSKGLPLALSSDSPGAGLEMKKDGFMPVNERYPLNIWRMIKTGTSYQIMNAVQNYCITMRETDAYINVELCHEEEIGNTQKWKLLFI